MSTINIKIRAKMLVVLLIWDQAFIQAVLLMSIFEQKLSFRMFYFMTMITKLL